MDVFLLNTGCLLFSLSVVVWAGNKIWDNAKSKDSKGKAHFHRHKRAVGSRLAISLNYLWRKQYRLVILVLTLLASYVILFADNLLPIENIPPKDELTSLLLLVTGAIVFWYTRETFDLKVITQNAKTIQQQQFDFENRPYLRLQWHNGGKSVLQIVNDGKGLARDVCFEPMTLEGKVLFAPLRRPVIAPHQYTDIGIAELQTTANRDEITGYGNYTFDVKQHIDNLLKKGKVKEIQVSYLDLREQVYDAFFTPDERYNDRFNIRSQEKRK